MGYWLGFIVSLGSMLVIIGTMSAWVFRASYAPLWIKMVLPVLLMVLACYTPFSVASVMGRPVVTSIESLPDHMQLVSFLAHDEAGTVDLWIVDGESARAFEVPLSKSMKKALREANEQTSQGRIAYMSKKPKDRKGPEGMSDLKDDYVPEFELDHNAIGPPPKG